MPLSSTAESLPEITEKRILEGWNLSNWADRLLEHAGVGVTIIDPDGKLLFYNKWALNNLDRKPEYIGVNVKNNHKRKVTNPRFDAMLQLFKDGRRDPVRYVARPYGKTTIIVTVSPIIVDDELVGFSQIVLLKDEIEEMINRFNDTGRESFERAMLPDSWTSEDGEEDDAP